MFGLGAKAKDHKAEKDLTELTGAQKPKVVSPVLPRPQRTAHPLPHATVRLRV